MGTKNDPGTFDCYENAAPDEPMFVLLARDPDAPRLVEDWAQMREDIHGWGPHADQRQVAKIEEARTCAKAMREWRAAQ